MRTPRLRGLLALNLCAAAGGAMVFVNTVVLVRGPLQGREGDVAWALAAFGAGSMAVALLLPRFLDRLADRQVMLAAGTAMSVALFIGSALWASVDGAIGWSSVLALWFTIGASYAALVTPGGRLLKRSADAESLPFLFAAQFSLSHVCWLIAYPLAGWVGARYGLGTALGALTVLALVGLLRARAVWPEHDATVVRHAHPELPRDHPHLTDARDGTAEHAHEFRIDALHQRWPR
jgi:MFS family permease